MRRAVKKGTGELPGAIIEEFSYEGYGPSGVAVLVEVASDNRNRITAEVRHLFSKYGGNLGENGCVAWIFEKKGYFTFNAEKYNEEELMDIAIEAGAEDVQKTDDIFEVLSDPLDFDQVKEALDEKQMQYDSAEITRLPQNTVSLDGKQALSMLKLIELLEDNEDVLDVYSNFDIPDEVMAELT